MLSSKEGKLFAKRSGSLSASALLKGNNMLRNTDVTKINLHYLKGICLPDLSAAHSSAKCRRANKNALVRLQTSAQTPQWHFTHLVRGKDELHSPKSDSQPCKAERLLKLAVWQSWLFVQLTKSIPCKNKQKTPCEGKAVDFSPYYF